MADNHLTGVLQAKVMDFTSGDIVAYISRPNSSELEISDQRVMTNAVSVDEDKILFLMARPVYMWLKPKEK